MTLPDDLLLTLEQASTILQCTPAVLRRILTTSGEALAENVGAGTRKHLRVQAQAIDALRELVAQDAALKPGEKAAAARNARLDALEARVAKIEAALDSPVLIVDTMTGELIPEPPPADPDSHTLQYTNDEITKETT